MSATPHLDEEALAELQEVMDEEFEVLIHTFLSDSRERIAGLKRAVDVQDAEALAHMAHSFKGSCINIGAPQLGELCRVAETAGKEQRLEDAPATVDAIESEFQAITGMLENLLAR
ncbi:Hpt domain-containing protein [Marinobacter sp. M216]|uniref:Hpt domain-containing protein n=1 Tax=Marinobacter albus TaxID=3030833 RepID=A0ABT7HAH8_9GAMM|nr:MULTISPECIES: Hpt domain-containing protein [unclassified Marinobacter]MBW7470366.1 Hpt domain-containing protein [Marinobacter sp. F4218]MDK9557369.1 Hpt domain-containing protein [Marinobacter sp. M216]